MHLLPEIESTHPGDLFAKSSLRMRVLPKVGRVRAIVTVAPFDLRTDRPAGD